MWLVNHPDAQVQWTVDEHDGRVSTVWARDGEIRYTLQLIPAADRVDLVMTIRNLSGIGWHGVFAFNCVSPAKAQGYRDPSLERTYMSVDGRATALAGIPRTAGPRAGVTVYPTRRHGERLPPFARAFQATSPVPTDDSWLVVIAENGESHMATTTGDASFLFTNTAFGCIHAAPSFGDLAPGTEATVRSRVYFSQGGLEAFLRRHASDRRPR
jgi:hypothetical protein